MVFLGLTEDKRTPGLDPSPATALQALPRDLAVLADEITELAAHLNAATYRLLTLIREFEERSGWNGAGLKSCAHWLNWQCGINLGATPCRCASYPPLGRRR